MKKIPKRIEREILRRHKRKLPIFAIILLLFGVILLLNDLKIISINIPWVSLIIIVLSIGIIANVDR